MFILLLPFKRTISHTVNICKNDPILPLKTRIAKILLIHFPGVVHHQICYQNITVRSMKALQIFRKSVKWSHMILQWFQVRIELQKGRKNVKAQNFLAMYYCIMSYSEEYLVYTNWTFSNCCRVVSETLQNFLWLSKTYIQCTILFLHEHLYLNVVCVRVK